MQNEPKRDATEANTTPTEEQHKFHFAEYSYQIRGSSPAPLLRDTALHAVAGRAPRAARSANCR